MRWRVCPRKAPKGPAKLQGKEDLDKCSLDRMELERKKKGRKEGRQARQGGREEGWREDRPLFLLGQDPHGDLSGPAQGLTHQRRLMKHWLKERTSGPPGGEALRTKHSGY